jgi:N-dimethylarginine dimethylaminohydrolase
MRYSSRQREVSHYVEWFRARNYKVLALELPQGEYLEGHGDLLWHADMSKVWAGFGFRSSRGGVEKFVQAMQSLAIRVVPLELTDPSFYHLDTCMAPLNSEAVMIYVGAFSEAALASIRRDCARVHEVQREDALRFACNGVVANGKYIAPHLSPGVREILEREGLEPLEVNTSEFEKSGGSCFCLKTFIF